MRKNLLILLLLLPLLQACTAKKGEVPGLSGAAASVDASQSTVEASDNIIANGTATSEIVITLKNSKGETVEGVPPRLTVSGTNNTVSSCTVSDEEGISNCTVSSTKAEDKQITVNFPTTIEGPSVSFLPGPASRLGFLTEPGGGTAGTIWSQQPIIQIQDAFGNLVPDATGDISVALSSGTGTLSGTLTATASSGQAIFSDLSLQLVGTDKILTASSSGLTDISSSAFTIIGAANTEIVIHTQPGGGGAGVTWLQPPIIEFRDIYGNRTSSNAQVTVSLTTGTGTLGGSATVAAVDGHAIFSDITLDLLGSNKVLTFSSTGLTSVVSNNFTITHGPAAKLVFTIEPSGGNAGSIWVGQPRIEIRDALDNIVTSGADSTANVSLGVTGGGSLAGSSNMAAVSGVATFSGLSMTVAGSKTIVATKAAASVGALTKSSAAFTINIGAASKLAFVTQPGGGLAGATWAQQPTVRITDAYDNAVTTGTYNVSVALTTGTGALSGGATVASSSGVATYSNLSLNLAGTNKVLTATAAGLSSAASSAFSIIAGSAAKLAFSTQPSGGTAGTVWATQPVIEVQDASGNFINTATNSITLTLTTGSGTLAGTQTLSAVAGLASFSNLSLNLVGNDKVITASASGLTSALSTAFSITGGLPQANSNIVASPTTVIADGSTTSTVTVTVIDGYTNPVAGKSVTLTSNRGGTDTIFGSPATTNASGIATFTIKSSTAGSSVLTAMIPADSITLTTTPTIIFKSNIASIAQSEWSISPVSQIANGSTTSTVSVVIKNVDGDLLTGKSVTLTSSRGVTDTIVGSPATTNGSGVASFTIKSSTTGEPVLTIAVPSDSVTLTSSAYMTFLSVAPYADWQARLANSSTASMSEGINSPATAIWKDLFNIGPNNGDLNNFAYNTTASGWMGSGSGTVSSGTTGAFRLGFDGTDDFVNFGTGINSALTNFSFETWLRANSPTTAGKVITGNGDISDTGFVLRQSWLGNGFLEFTMTGNKSYLGEIISDSPTALYRTEEASGATANASVGGINGTYVGGITYAQTTAILDNSKTVRFNGTTGYINLGNNFNATANFAVEAWVRPQAVGVRKDFVNKEGTNNGWWLGMESTSRVSFAVGNGSTVHKVTGTTALVANTWYHVVGVRDSAAGLLRIYLNGVEETTIAFTGSPSNNSNNLYIANSAFAGSRFLNGRIDEVAIYQNNALAPARVAAHYAARLVPACHTTAAINNSSWYHIAGTFNNTSKAMVFYVNATSNCSITATGATFSGSIYPLAMGAHLDDSGSAIGSSYWNGAIGDLRVYNAVLSGANITAHRSATTARFP